MSRRNWPDVIDAYLKTHPGENNLLAMGKELLGADYDRDYKSMVRAATQHAERGYCTLSGEGAARYITRITPPAEQLEGDQEQRLEYDFALTNYLLELGRFTEQLRGALNGLQAALNIHIHIPDKVNVNPFERQSRVQAPGVELMKKSERHYGTARAEWPTIPPHKLPPHVHEHFRSVDTVLAQAKLAKVREDAEKKEQLAQLRRQEAEAAAAARVAADAEAIKATNRVASLEAESHAAM